MAIVLYHHPFSRTANTVWMLEEVGGEYERCCPWNPQPRVLTVARQGRHAPRSPGRGLGEERGLAPRRVSGRVHRPGQKHVMQWTTKNVLKILRNRLYRGYMETAANGRKRTTEPGSGKWLQTHEAIIPPALFEQVAQGLSARVAGDRCERDDYREWFLAIHPKPFHDADEPCCAVIYERDWFGIELFA